MDALDHAPDAQAAPGHDRTHPDAQPAPGTRPDLGEITSTAGATMRSDRATLIAQGVIIGVLFAYLLMADPSTWVGVLIGALIFGVIDIILERLR